MRRFSIAILMLLSPCILWGQYNETIRTGRPGQAIGAYTVGKNVFQLQSGFTYNPIENGLIETRSYSHNTVLRIGILERFEINGLVGWQYDLIKNGIDEQNRKGISNTQIGGRLNILERRGAIPAVGIQGRILLKAQSEDFRREKPGSKFILTTGNKITDWLSFGTNWGVTWSGNDQGPESLYIINGSIALTKTFGGFVEVYGSFNQFSVNYDAGFSLLLNNDLQMDISAGWQGDSQISDWFVDLGVSWRIDWRK